METEKYHDGEEDMGKFSPECYLLSFITTCGIIVILLMLYSILHSMPYPDEKHTIPRYFSLERRHKVFVAMTENLDCSLYMKNLAAKGKLSMQAVMRSGIMCISSVVPYSAAGMFSTFSMMTFRQMSPDGLVRSAAFKGIKEFANTNQNVDRNKNYTFDDTKSYTEQVIQLPVMDAKSLPTSISKKPLDFISVRYAYLHPERKEYFVTFFFYRYVGTMIPRTSPNLETSSIFSAFILSLITKILKPELLQMLPPVEKEAYIMHLMLGSQQVAYELLPQTHEWDGSDSKWKGEFGEHANLYWVAAKIPTGFEQYI
ncbi:unnamed protein product [Angiostrongylus costaricensis]|uniref:SERPIN domain-containing protein n=1 Tax=Angiostrongylus costaricensis TaxID=334426 RepID=A0A0R3PMV8_ANGCS|nr:unnamed protein product [Angiostrongylus costaricensis]